MWCVTVITALLLAACGQGMSDTSSTDRTRAAIIDSVAAMFATRYVYPEVGARMDSMLRANFAEGAYNAQASLSELAESITNDLLDISNDRHIWVGPIPEDRWYVTEGDTVTEDQILARSLDNFGWTKLEHLRGAVEYVKVDRFEDASYASHVADVALSFMANCKTLIIDLRENHGGYDNMLKLVASYFFAEPTQLSSLYWTYNDSTEELWTQASVRGTPLYDRDLYLLTSQNTASGAEAFAYHLKHLGRATIIGEKTRGAAHWSDWYEFPQLGIAVHVPVARPINPVTGTNWEGTGVQPDIEVPAQQALDVAHLEALQRLRLSAAEPTLMQLLDWTIPPARAVVNPVSIGRSLMEKYVGRYINPDTGNQYVISTKNGALRYEHYSGSRYILTPLTETLFTVGETDDMRLQFIADEKGDVTEFRLIEPDGSIYRRIRVGD